MSLGGWEDFRWRIGKCRDRRSGNLQIPAATSMQFVETIGVVHAAETLQYWARKQVWGRTATAELPIDVAFISGYHRVGDGATG